MAKEKKPNAPPDIVALYDRMVASCPDVVRLGVTMPNTSLNGNMFSFIHLSGAVALRLPAGTREEFIAKYETKLYDAYGMVQKEYVDVPRSLLENIDELAPYFAASWVYCQTLKPKKRVGQ